VDAPCQPDLERVDKQPPVDDGPAVAAQHHVQLERIGYYMRDKRWFEKCLNGDTAL
jgi:hypothetical protein